MTQSGNLNVPPDYTDQFCGGACLKETDLVLNCINDVLSNFLFFNHANVRAVKDTIKDGCSFGPSRGNKDHIYVGLFLITLKDSEIYFVSFLNSFGYNLVCR